MSSFKDLTSQYFAKEPKKVEGYNNTSFIFYRKYLTQIVKSLYNFENIPSSWDIDYIKDSLFNLGSTMCVCDTDYGLLQLRCGYSGVNIYGKPLEVVVSNPILGSFNRKIGIDAEMVYLMYYNNTFVTLNDIIDRYAQMLAQIDGSINVNLINSRISYVFTSTNKASLKTMQKLYDDVSKGKPVNFALFENGEVESQPWFNNVKNSYIVTDLLKDKQSIKAEFLTLIGIPNIPFEKKERLIQQETETNQIETYSLIGEIVKTLNDCYDRARDTFNDDILKDIRVTINYNEVENLQNEYTGGGEDEF